MLSSEYIHEKILYTSSCTSEDVRKLAELMELYPYVSSFPILYLKALSNSKDVRLESEIEKYAYRISSRVVLFELLNPRFDLEIENPVRETVEVEEEKVPQAQTPIEEEIENLVIEKFEVEDENTEEQQEIVEEVEDTILKTVHVEEEKKPEVQVETVEEVENPILEITEVEKEIVLEEKRIEFKKEIDELEQLIQSAAISSSFIETNYHEEEKETKLELEIEKTPESEFEAEKKIEKFTTIENTEIESQSERSFSSWLSLGATTSVVNPIETKVIKDESEQAEVEDEPKKIEYYNFEKPKKEFYSPIKKAKESLSENNMPVSETLAKIFALQGNYPKSIYVYQQLILIFPEKKSFFATQIKNLKKKLNS